MTTIGQAPPDRKSTTWWVEILIDEEDGTTRASAHLHQGGGTATGATTSATGLARLNPTDHDVPVIGDELAAARALSALAEDMLRSAAHDIADATHEPVTFRDVT